MDDSELVSGLYPKMPNDSARHFVIGKLGINVEQFRGWMKDYLNANPGAEWINIDMELSKAEQAANSKKGYAAIDTWKPDTAPAPKPVAAPEPMAAPEDIPF